MEQVKEMLDQYIEKYCRTYHVTREEAIDHLMVKLVAEYYSEEANEEE